MINRLSFSPITTSRLAFREKRTITVDTDTDFIEQIRKGKEELIEVGKTVYDRGLTSGTGGNISCKCGDFILIKAARACLGMLKPEDISVVDLGGKLVSGPKPSSELPVHMQAYKERPDIGAVIHTHSPYIQVYAIAHQPIDCSILPDIAKNFGQIPYEQYHHPGSNDLAINTTRHLKNKNLVIMGNHGLLAVGPNLKAALKVADVAENTAKVSYLLDNSKLTRNTLTEAQIQELKQ